MGRRPRRQIPGDPPVMLNGRTLPGNRLPPLIGASDTNGEARGVAQAWLRNQMPGAQVEGLRVQSFAEGWLVSLPVPRGALRIGGVRLVVDKDDLSVHSFPANRPADWTIREYVERKARGDRP